MRHRIAALAALALLLAACPPAETPAEVDLDAGAAAPSSSVSPSEPDAAPLPPKPTAAGTALFVADAMVECTGEAPMKCMRVRGSADEAWRLHYGGIDGFTYEPGFFYELRVERVDAAKPPADAPAWRYRLLEVVSKHKANPGP